MNIGVKIIVQSKSRNPHSHMIKTALIFIFEIWILNNVIAMFQIIYWGWLGISIQKYTKRCLYFYAQTGLSYQILRIGATDLEGTVDRN